MKRFLILSLIMVFVFSLSACGGGNETPAPTEEAQQAEATAEPTAEATEPDNTPAGAWHVDLDNDGSDEQLVLNDEELEENGFAVPYVLLTDGTRLELPQIAVSHAGAATYGITELDGREYVLYYRPSWYNGTCEDYYCLYTVENGTLKEARSGHVEFEVSSVRPLDPVDVDKVMAFVDEINDIWQHSRLAFTTDVYTVGRSLYGRSDGALHLLDGMAYFTAPEGKDAESYYYVEALARLDDEFGFDAEEPLTAREKLEAANAVMAEYHNTGDPTEKLIGLAWPAAEKAMAMYGGEVSREYCYIEAEGVYAIVTFYATDVDPLDYDLSDPSISVYFRNYDDADDWGITRVQYYMSFPKDYDWDAYAKQNEALPAELDFNVTAASASDAAWEAAKAAAKWFIELPEDSVFCCTDAAPLSIATGENYTEQNPQYTVSIGFVPKDYLAFAHRFGEWSHGLCIFEDEHNLFYTVDLNVWVIDKNADGSYHIGIELPEDGPWG